MTLVAFDLTMPGCGSWDGKWSGRGGCYALVRAVSPKQATTLKPSYGYHWSDGWSARVSVREIEASEARKLRKRSDGFCGYEWMVAEILAHGRIRTEVERRETSR